MGEPTVDAIDGLRPVAAINRLRPNVLPAGCDLVVADAALGAREGHEEKARHSRTQGSAQLREEIGPAANRRRWAALNHVGPSAVYSQSK